MRIVYEKGFTLIELLVVIAVVGILAGAIIVVINPVEQINKAMLVKAKSFHGQLVRTNSLSSVGTWDFNDSSMPGRDTSGYNNHGTQFGATYNENCDIGYRGCLSFNGAGDYFRINDSATISPAYITLALWVKVLSYSGSYPRLIAKNGAYDLMMYTFPGGEGRLEWDLRIPGEVNAVTPAANKLQLNRWYHLVTTFDGSTASIYINGEKKATLTGLSGTITDNTNSLEIARSGAFNGEIDEVYVFNNPLTSIQIQSFYARSLMRRYLALQKK